ncbi:MAG: penicillin-binding protein 2 [Ignavibacteriales bacterium]|nr:penicillin-binding protein 2 [Ignavibacteriales bacterium]
MNDDFIKLLVRKRIIQIFVFLFFALIIYELIKIQIVENISYLAKSEQNSIKKMEQQAPRGVFYDRNFKLLVTNKPSFVAIITPTKYDSKFDSLLENKLQLDSGYIQKILSQSTTSRFLPIKIKKDIGYDFIAWYEENSDKLPGISYEIEIQRDYITELSGAHAFGYTKEITSKQLQDNKETYSYGDIVGSAGLEKYYEKELKGQKGISYILVDSKQRVIGKYADGKHDIPPVKGNDLVLSLDYNLQKVAEESLEGYRGGVVAIEPKTGEILVFASSPTFNLSQFAGSISPETWQTLLNDPKKPLFNRVSSANYSPGSSYKMVLALAGLEEKIITTSWTIGCGGGLLFGNKFFACTHAHGSVNVTRAIEGSCNTFFYQLMLKIGLANWAKYSRLLGFGSKTGIDFPEDNAGLIPDSNYYDKTYGEGKWRKGFLISLGIGQGECSVTILQLAQYAALLANYGETYKPHLVKGVIQNETQNYIPLKFKKIKVPISKNTFDIVRDGMYRVVHGNGTARSVLIPGITIAGKTGTVQNPHGANHAVFIAFAPYDDPKIAVAVLIENVGFGATYAAPIARRIIQEYLGLKEQNIELVDTTKVN